MSLAGFPLSSNYLDQLKNYSRHFRLKASTVSEDDAVFLSGRYARAVNLRFHLRRGYPVQIEEVPDYGIKASIAKIHRSACVSGEPGKCSMATRVTV